MKIKIDLRKKSRQGNSRPFGLLIINTTDATWMTRQQMYDLSKQAKDLLNESSDRRSNVVLSFGAGVTAKYFRLG